MGEGPLIETGSSLGVNALALGLEASANSLFILWCLWQWKFSHMKSPIQQLQQPARSISQTDSNKGSSSMNFKCSQPIQEVCFDNI